MAAITRDGLVEDLAMRFGVYVTGTAATASTDTAVIDTTNLIEPVNFYAGAYLGMTSGPADGEYRQVQESDQFRGEARVYPPFSADVTASSATATFEIIPVQRDKLHQAINAAIVAIGDSWPKLVTDTTTISSISGGDYDYSLPAALQRLLGVYTRNASDHGWRPVPPDRYGVSGTPGAQSLEISRSYPLPVGAAVRLDYAARPDTMSASGNTLGIGEPYEREAVDFIIEYGLYWLHDLAASTAKTEGELALHQAKAARAREMAELVRARAGVRYGQEGE